MTRARVTQTPSLFSPSLDPPLDRRTQLLRRGESVRGGRKRRGKKGKGGGGSGVGFSPGRAFPRGRRRRRIRLVAIQSRRLRRRRRSRTTLPSPHERRVPTTKPADVPPSPPPLLFGGSGGIKRRRGLSSHEKSCPDWRGKRSVDDTSSKYIQNEAADFFDCGTKNQGGEILHELKKIKSSNIS